MTTEEWVQAQLAKAPPLTDEQKRRLGESDRYPTGYGCELCD